MVALAISATMAVLYLLLIRLLDLNEREPVWAVFVVFGIGVPAAMLLHVVVPSPVLELTSWQGAFATEVSRFVALFVGLEIVRASARARGWSEINGPMDGIVYGAAAGLGFAVGEELIERITMMPVGLPTEPLFTIIWTSALAGMRHALFGAIAGIGLSLLYNARRKATRIAGPALGLTGAVVANVLYRELAYGSALGGGQAYLRAWVALLLPLAFVIVISIYSLRRERRIILDELEAELSSGVIHQEDLRLVASHGRRHALYVRTLFAEGPFRFMTIHALHNLQAQLAFIRRRAARETNDERREALLAEAERLRSAMREHRNLHGFDYSPEGGSA